MIEILRKYNINFKKNPKRKKQFFFNLYVYILIIHGNSFNDKSFFR